MCKCVCARAVFLALFEMLNRGGAKEPKHSLVVLSNVCVCLCVFLLHRCIPSNLKVNQKSDQLKSISVCNKYKSRSMSDV